MEPRRRQTLAAIDPNNQYGAAMAPTGIPMPASALKKSSFLNTAAVEKNNLRPTVTASGRMSMAPATRMSSQSQQPTAQANLLGRPSAITPASHQAQTGENANRATTNGSALYNSLVSSGNRGDGGYFTGSRSSSGRMSYAAPNSARRSSTYQARPSSSAFGNVSSILTSSSANLSKDPRPVRDKNYQHVCATNIINYLQLSAFPGAVTAKTLSQPTAKDFQTIFKYLYNRLDATYQFGVGGRKFEDEVVLTLKNVRYPFADQISKSQLMAVGSMHSWPGMLAMLNWLVEMVMCQEKLGTGEFDEDIHLLKAATDSQSAGSEIPNHAEKLFFAYLSRAYGVFLAGEDDFTDMEKELAENFDRKNEHTLKEIEKLEAENEDLQAQVKLLRVDNSPLSILEREGSVLNSDKEKFNQYIEYLRSKKAKLHEGNVRLRENLQAKELELAELHNEKRDLQRQVEAQRISPADVDRMTAEREQLSKNIELLNVKIEESSKEVWEKEIALQKKGDEVEQLIQQYTALAYRLSLLPKAPDAYAALVPTRSFEVELNLGASSSNEIVTPHIRGPIRKALKRHRTDQNELSHKMEDEAIALQESLDRVLETVADRRDEVEAVEARLTAMVEQYNEAKDTMTTETATSNAEMERLERDLTQMRHAAQQGLLAVVHREQALTIECDSFSHSSAALQEETYREVIHILDEIIKFKMHIQNGLEALEQVALEGARTAVAESGQEYQAIGEAENEED